MRHFAHVDETDALRDTAYNQQAAQEKNHCERRHHWIDQRIPARIIRPPCTKYQSECRLTFSRMASRMTWAAASSDIVMVLLHPPMLLSTTLVQENSKISSAAELCESKVLILQVR